MPPRTAEFVLVSGSDEPFGLIEREIFSTNTVLPSTVENLFTGII